MRLEEDSASTIQEERKAETAMEEAVLDDNVNLAVEGDGEELERLKLSSQTDETVDVSSEQSWMLRWLV
ncbi:hypothetical protein V6N12_049679 [Hibiscus sabdariffa]|uniref:Uncharacterized protein n=1 Tax=Hibiscus sabdariffa TaxID=183260 RepID=A0ABR2GBC5_9ROSI